MEHKLDLRVIKTRNNIKNTFILLLNEKDFDQITVQNILEKALINRSTFYKHYTDKFDLAKIITEEILVDYSSFLDERFADKNKGDLSQYIKNVYDRLLDQKDILCALWKINTNSIHLYDDMLILLKNKYKAYIVEHNVSNLELTDYHACIYASLVMTTTKYIFENSEQSITQKIVESLKPFLDSVAFPFLNI
ncbi:MAG: TetR/AcrR family transcriptional regulator [Clostridiaceae bacterium]|nr:TetR/AcrR family transcriptional regulator [Clostridiaceae bacterium]